MNKKVIKFAASFATVAAAILLHSCAMESPFGNGGEGLLTIDTRFRGDVSVVTRANTRAEAAEQETLRENCVVYIENSRGVIRKYKGADNIPSYISLNVGSYVAEAWSGDSVSASFSQKFYRGYQPFEVTEGTNTLTLHCNIANVLASVTPESLQSGLSDLKVEFSHSRGSLTFSEENISEKGYFMMPNADSDLSYKVTGLQDDGTPFLREGKIENVKRAHEYRLNITSEAGSVHDGGALIRIRILEVPVIDETVEIFPAPTLKGLDFNAAEQIVKGSEGFTDVRVLLIGYEGMSSILWNPSANFVQFEPGMNILNKDVMTSLEAMGINVEVVKSKDAAPSLEDGEVDVDEVYVTFSKAFLDALPESSEEYVIEFESTNGFHKTGYGTLRFANSDDAIEHPAPISTAPAPNPVSEPMAVLAHSATLSGNLHDSEVTGFGIRYREQGTSSWTEVYPSGSNAAAARHALRTSAPMKAPSAKFSVQLTGLKPSTTYEYQAFSPGFDNCEVKMFTTEAIYQIPNSSMEDWSTYASSNKNVVFPGLGSERTFWDSGNQGGAIASITMTNKSSDMAHSGMYSARLASAAAMGIVLAAGNIFVGSFVKTDGTNGVLSFGRPYNGSHPSKLRVYANYRPGTVNLYQNANAEFLTEINKGESDHGQIYVAFTDEAIDIRTNPNDRKLFSTDDPHVLAYGQVTWKEAFGPDGQLEAIDIPIEYFDRAHSTAATHIVLVACASKFGDFFTGSSSSVMYLDDFELIYE